MSLTQFKDPRIHSYKSINHRSKNKYLSRHANKFDIP